jgi:hypothetical protein
MELTDEITGCGDVIGEDDSLLPPPPPHEARKNEATSVRTNTEDFITSPLTA